MGSARAEDVVALPPHEAIELWLDTSRWASFVDGVARVAQRKGDWPEPGASVVWESPPRGRGTVTEKVVELQRPGRVVVQVFDNRLTGRQTTTFGPHEEGALVTTELDFRLTDDVALGAIADFLFVRRAVRDSLRRTLRRFAVEVDEEAALRDAPL